MLSPIEADNLADLPGIRHGFFTRAGGVSEGIYAGLNCGLGSKDDRDAVLQNRARVANYLGATDPAVLTPYQIHSADAVIVEAHLPAEAPFPAGQPPNTTSGSVGSGKSPNTTSGSVGSGKSPNTTSGSVGSGKPPNTTSGSFGQQIRADAIVTRTPGLAIGILTADCGPVLLADPKARVVAAAHAGWRGAVAGILDAAIAAMEELGAHRENIHAALGPCITQPNYEVGADFQESLVASNRDFRRFFTTADPDGKPHFDLPAFILADLETKGIASIVSSVCCTYENESKFFSFRRTTHRREQDYGRQIAAIVVA